HADVADGTQVLGVPVLTADGHPSIARNATWATSPTSRSSARRTAFLTGSANVPAPVLSGNTDVRQVVAPMVTSTRTEPKPRGGPARSRISSLTSSGTVTNTHESPCLADHSQSSASNSIPPVWTCPPTDPEAGWRHGNRTDHRRPVRRHRR